MAAFQLSYRSYWHNTIVGAIVKKMKLNDEASKLLENAEDGEFDTNIIISIHELCELTSIRKEDVISTLQLNEMYAYRRGSNVIQLNTEMLDAYERTNARRVDRIDATLIKYRVREWGKKK